MWSCFLGPSFFFLGSVTRTHFVTFNSLCMKNESSFPGSVFFPRRWKERNLVTRLRKTHTTHKGEDACETNHRMQVLRSEEIWNTHIRVAGQNICHEKYHLRLNDLNWVITRDQHDERFLAHNLPILKSPQVSFTFTKHSEFFLKIVDELINYFLFVHEKWGITDFVLDRTCLEERP